MKELYTKPEFDITVFENSDVIATSFIPDSDETSRI